MAISDATGSISHNNKNIADTINSATSSVSGTVGGGGGGGFDLGGLIAGLTGGGAVDFAGMDGDNISTFESAIDRYREDIQAIIDGFNEEADLEVALKGDVATAVHDFLTSVKALLNAYVSAIDIEKKEIQEAHQNYLAATGSIAGNVSSDSDAIRSQANGISID